jgi:hypothetical protein
MIFGELFWEMGREHFDGRLRLYYVGLGLALNGLSK